MKRPIELISVNRRTHLNITDKENLIQTVHQLTSTGDIIAIDGWARSGKTTLSTCICQRLNCSLISIDSYYIKSTDNTSTYSYHESINHSLLKHDILETSKMSIVLIEGCCILDFLDLYNLKRKLHIYVNKITIKHIGDIEIIENSIDSGTEAQQLNEIFNPIFHDLNENTCVSALINYHKKRNLLKSADIIFSWECKQQPG